ncbi:hypothetical protein [Pleionea sp. CnH1-48]|uniref:hypothetical protein n=1 Tax=Pleionea sp. CnH1-48 TaxID=2954494 RepID=UPI00209803FD|nr:hypothetical protein [Pleionea sp. CnH1-48]MCO7223574.1 hypothetical protein [Pleionea sp. CnH1-48]
MSRNRVKPQESFDLPGCFYVDDFGYFYRHKNHKEQGPFGSKTAAYCDWLLSVEIEQMVKDINFDMA